MMIEAFPNAEIIIFEQWPVTVPKDDDLGVRKRLVQFGGFGAVELIAVRHDDGETVQLDFGDLRKLRPQVEAVAVAVHRRYGRERAQLDEEILAPYVPAMQDVIDFLEDLENLRPQHAVRIRDDAKSHGACDAVT